MILPASLSEQLLLGHPWVYRDHVPAGFDAPSGSWVLIRSGGFEAYALWDRASAIALRVFSRRLVPDAVWFETRLAEALALRASLREAGTTAFRLLYGEGDGVPGVSVDLYDRYAVIVTYAESLDSVVPQIVTALRSQLELEGIVRRRRDADVTPRLQLLWGKEPSRQLLVLENGMRLAADLYSGQKTGLFLDHRENRGYIRNNAAGRQVLNLFAYTGAFSVSAALGGARSVTSVDVAPAAIAQARENFALNGLPAELHDAVVSDVFEYLARAREEKRQFDLIVCDPPSFAASQKKQYAALRAYVRLNALGLGCVAPGGLYAAASCTAQVSPEAFRHGLGQSARVARVRLQIIHDVGQPLDHPVFAGHPEGRYLKFVVGRVLAPA